MYISHSVMEGQRHNNHLNLLAFVYTSTKNCKDDDSTAQGNTKEWGHKQVSILTLVRVTNTVFLGKPVNESGGQWTFLSMVRGHERSAARFRSGSSAVSHIR